MSSKAEIIAILKKQHPTIRVGSDEAGYTELPSAEYKATIEQWADGQLAKEKADADANELRQNKITAYQKLGLSEAEIEALLPTPAEPIS
jgi:hypothetical protein